MRLLPHSNGVRKVNMKKKRDFKEKLKIVAITFIVILLSGYIAQRWSNFIAKETLRQTVDYTTVDDIRMDYRVSGDSGYTIVFDGAMGTNLEGWNSVVEELESDQVQTFVYNRRGYGYSGGGLNVTPEEQAEDLKILLRKAGMPEPYILVGEEYGSLVLTSFAEKFKESVIGVVLVDPINENEEKSKENSIGQLFTRVRRKIESLGSNIWLTELLDKLNLDVNLDDFEKGLEGDALVEFKTQRTKSNYTAAVYNELINVIKGKSNSQKEGVFKDIPYILLTKNENDNLAKLGDEELTSVHISTVEKDFLAINDTTNIVNAIRQMVKTLDNIKIMERTASS